MIKKYLSHTLQTNPRHREEEPKNINRNNTHQEDKRSKATRSLFLVKMIAKLERTRSNACKNKDQTQNHHTQ